MISKTSGFRTIVVAERQFKWQFQGVVVVFLDECSGRETLTIDFGWFHDWCYLFEPENMPPPFEPRKVTPLFVALAIAFALDNGWNPEKRGGKFRLVYSKETGFQTLGQKTLGSPTP